MRSGGAEGGYCDLRRAVKAEGKAYCAQTAVDVELHRAEVIVAFRVDLSHGWKCGFEGAEAGETDLSTVGVAGEDQVYELAAGMFDDGIDVVGLVGHDDDGGVRAGGHDEIEIWMAAEDVVQAAEPEVLTAAFDAGELVDEERDSVVLQVVADDEGVENGVVVAEDAEALGAIECIEQGSAAAGGGEGDARGLDAVGDVVAGDEDEVRGEGVDAFDHLGEEELFSKLFKVNIADLDEAEAVEGGGQVADGKGALGDVDVVAGEFAGVEGDAGCRGCGAEEEVAAGVAGGSGLGTRGRGNDWHSS